MSENSTSSTTFADDNGLRPKEAAQKARVSVGTIYAWMHEGRFRTWVIRRRGLERGCRYIERSSFESFLQAQREEALT